MKKTIFFLIGFSFTFMILTLYSTHRVHVEIETNNPQNIQVTNWGKQFEQIKYPEKNRITFWNRFHTINDNIGFEIPQNTTVEFISLKVAGRTYSVSEIKTSIIGKTGIESIKLNKASNVLVIKTQINSKGNIQTNLNALTDLQKQYKYVPLILSLVMGTVLLIFASKICSFSVGQLEKSPWLETVLCWIEARTMRDFVIIGILLLFLTFGYLTLAPPLVADNICFYFPHGGMISRWFCEERLYGLLLFILLPLFDTIPIFLSFFGCVFLFITASIYNKIFHCTPIEKICVYLLFLTFPTWSYVWVFYFMSLQTGLFAMLAVVSFYYFTRKNNGETLPLRDYFISLLFFFFACWGFETTPTIFFVLLATWLLTVHFNKLSFLQLLKQGIFAISITGLSSILTLLFGKILRIALGSPRSENFEHYKYFSDQHALLSYFSTVSNSLLKIFEMFPWDWYILIWFILIPATFILLFVKSKNNKIWIHLLLLIGMIISPFLLTFLIGCPTPPRACVAYPFMVTGLAFILLYHVKTRWIIFLILCLCFAIMFKNTFYINKRNFYENKEKELIEFKINRITNMIYDLDADHLPLVLVGRIDNSISANIFPSIPNFYAQYAIFSYNGHTPKNEPTINCYNWAVDMSKTWPSYPNKACAKVVDSIMIIKLSESVYKDK